MTNEGVSKELEINRKWAMPNSKTFSIKPIQELIINVSNRCGKHITIVDPFANEQLIKQYIEFDKYISNDLDTQYNTDYHLDATDFLKIIPSDSVDLVLYDPPYSPRQVSEVYKKLDMSVNMQTTQSSYWSKQKKEISRIVKKNGRVITFGWNSGGIGKSNGFIIEEILLVPHGGWHNDTICTVEIKTT